MALMCLLVLFAGVLSLTGCGQKKIKGLVQAEGVLLYEGSPLAWATLSFLPDNEENTQSRVGTAMTDENGHFRIRTQGMDGTFPGKYRVAVEKYLPNKGKNTVKEWKQTRSDPLYKEPLPEETMNVVNALPKKYSSVNTSGLTLQVEPNGNTNIKIEF